jgi:hypothetical protein
MIVYLGNVFNVKIFLVVRIVISQVVLHVTTVIHHWQGNVLSNEIDNIIYLFGIFLRNM